MSNRFKTKDVCSILKFAKLAHALPKWFRDWYPKIGCLLVKEILSSVNVFDLLVTMEKTQYNIKKYIYCI